MEIVPLEIEEQEDVLQQNGVHEDERSDKLRQALIEAQFAVLRTYKPFLNASIEIALAYLFPGQSGVAMMENAPPKMWRKSPASLPQTKAVGKQVIKAEPKNIVSVPLKCAVIYDYLLPWILADYKEHAPNEYAFICSGYVVDGIATITDYYPGKMIVSTPVDCRLDLEFAQDVIYNQVPDSHNIICWSHIHPIEFPSTTDLAAFDEHANWDEEELNGGLVEKRSLGMIISGATHTITIFDTHDYRRPLKHFVLPFGGKKRRNV